MMNFQNNNDPSHGFSDSKLLLIILLFFALFINGTSQNRPLDSSQIVAQIGNKTITVEDFLQRSELTVRPVYLKDKNTAINNLIAEKTLALEAEGSATEFLNKPGIAGKLRGIKEQMMREALYYEVAFNKAQVDTTEINKVYRSSMREYELEFYVLKSKDLAQKVQTVLDSMPELTDKMFEEFAGAIDKKPVHRINYNDNEDDVIHKALYSELLDTGTVLGPLRLNDGNYIIMKVTDYIDYPLISSEDQRLRWNKVQNKLHQAAASKLWQEFQADLMRGKKVEFDPNSFEVLKNLAFEMYLSSDATDSINFQIAEIVPSKPEINPNAPFFRIDDQTWTIDDFKRELLAHPLIFRTRNLTKDNFAEQFKLAVVDLIRDYYLTQESYKRGLDQSPEIDRTLAIWQDALIAQNQIKTVLKEAVSNGIINDDPEELAKYRETYIKKLQAKYSSNIRINLKVYEQISLNKVDFFAYRPGMPHPTTIPAFPVLIQSGDLTYAKQTIDSTKHK